MPEIKVGSRIRVDLPEGVEGHHGDYYRGDVGTVRCLYGEDSLEVTFDEPSSDGGALRCHYTVRAYEVELIEIPQVELLFM